MAVPLTLHPLVKLLLEWVGGPDVSDIAPTPLAAAKVLPMVPRIVQSGKAKGPARTIDFLSEALNRAKPAASGTARAQQLKREAAEILKHEDFLGFDTLGEALQAIRQHPDWAQRWDVPAGKSQQILESWRLSKGPSRPSFWQLFQQYVRGELSKKEFDEVIRAFSFIP